MTTENCAPRCPSGRRGLRRLVRGGAQAIAVGVAVAALPLLAAAQKRAKDAPPVDYLETETGARVPIKSLRGFKLFAEEDLAANGMKMTGGYGWGFPNNGPCPYYALTTPAFFCARTQLASGTFVSGYFEIQLVAGTPISDFRKIRSVWPGAANMVGSLGYTTPYFAELASPKARRWGPADGQFGNLFSGVTTTQDGSCRDATGNSNGQVPVGFTMLAGSDCPETWPSGIFKGKHPVTDSGWVAAFNADKANFHWNDWQVPVSGQDTSSFIGSYSMYGAISDSYREQIARYGSVTKLGSGVSQDRGYPLGLDIRFDAWQFSRPSIRNAVFWQITVVNNSERIYGAKIDYDSLYMGVAPGYLINGSQTVSWYFDIPRNTVIGVNGNTSGKCNTSYPRRTTATGGCPTTSAFSNGVQAIMFLKSPLGDVRNKLFTNPSSPYYNPTSKYADDTITFNHAATGGFGTTYNNTFGRSDRALFGYLSNTEDNFLDGRTINDFTVGQLWSHFRAEQFNATIAPEAAKFPKFVPGLTPGFGSWDYDNDGIQDSISFPTCGHLGCAANWSDTTHNGLVNSANNVGNTVTAGPFKLKGGDTTQFLIVFAGAPDSASYESLLNSVISSYQNNFAGANPVPPPAFTARDVEVTSAQVRDSTAGVQTAQVRIRITEPNAYDDKFVQSLLGNLQNSQDVRYKRLRTLNPNLVSRVQARVRANYSQLLIFKSCDKGATWTTSQAGTGSAENCRPARATDPAGRAVGFGWQPRSVINVDTTTGKLTSNVFTDVVLAGRTYLYSFVTRTRGVIDLPIVDSIGCAGTTDPITKACSNVITGPTNLQKALNIDADTISSPLFRSGPSTVLVYAPITLPAGTKLATLDTTRTSGSTTLTVTATARSTVQPGNYRIFFANQFDVYTARDTVHGTSTQRIVAKRIIRNAATSPTGTPASLVVDSAVFFSDREIVLQGTTSSTNSASTIITTVPATRDSVRSGVIYYHDVLQSFNFTTGGVGYIVARADSTNAAGATRAFFLSTTTLNNPRVEFETSADFPGFVLTLEALPTTAAAPRRIVTGTGAATAGLLIRKPGDTLYVSVHEANGVIYQSGVSLKIISGGKYDIKWQGDAFGPLGPFKLAPKETLQPIVTQSLSQRPVGMRTATDTMTDRLARATVAANSAYFGTTYLTRHGPLVEAKLPFELRNEKGDLVTLAMFRRNIGTADSALRNSILLGTLGDTTRVQVPADVWMPGDTLIMIETLQADSTVVNGATTVTVLDPQTLKPVQKTTTAVTFPGFVLSCATTGNPSRNTCNPISLGTVGATGYLPYQSGWRTLLDFPKPFDLFGEVRLTATAPVSNAVAASKVNRQVVVSPNPYVVQGNYDVISAGRVGTPTVMFTNVPDQGVLRIYSVSGQFLQQLTWTQADLVSRGQNLAGPGAVLNGDLPYNLRTREGLELGTGLYLFVITGTGPHKGFQQRGKFVIIR